MTLTGLSRLGDALAAPSARTFHALDPSTAAPLAPAFHAATLSDAEHAVALAAAAAPMLAAASGAEKGRFLRAVADRLDADRDALVARAHAETALPLPRLVGEVGRTTGQLRLFAQLVEDGHWVDARVETADPSRTPVPKPDHRSMHRALGPVVVFGASNFPFAFSVAGGDTASALAAGCPVVVKAHPAHPGTSEAVAAHVRDAVQACGLPDGTFSLLFDDGHDVGTYLVGHPAVRAVGFTGSRGGGLALLAVAAARPVPIPVYAEMSSVNPVFVCEGALEDRFDALVDGLAASCTLGVGQFCTQPGLLVLARTPRAERFVDALAVRLDAAAAAPMLTPAMQDAYRAAAAARAAVPGVSVVGAGPSGEAPEAASGVRPVLFAAALDAFLASPALQDELFGPSSLVVWTRTEACFAAVADALEGQLTATVHGRDADLAAHAGLLATLSEKAGRVVANGFPTGVEVSHAMVHGGPFPALSDGRSTSVGTQAVYRFTRLVCYQGLPDALLPPALQAANPLGLRRMVNGAYTADAL